MPPTRTLPAKAVKTERTHEENQERAYVAASRRSDRSLEARVESARRASEIHKRRTGRALRIREEDVANEEMYEEEDDGLPLRYRHIADHLNSTNMHMNNRIHAYLSTNMAMRSIVADAMASDHSYPYPNAPQFTNTFSPAMGVQQAQHNRPLQQVQDPATFRYTPYPTSRPPPQQGFQPSQHHRSASFASLPMREKTTESQPSPAGPPGPPLDNRRMSMPPSVPSTAGSPLQMHTPASIHSVHSTPLQRPTFSSRQSYGLQQPVSEPQQQPYMAYAGSPLQQDFSPFTTQLPPEAQGLLGSTLDRNDPFNSMLMAGCDGLPSNYYDFGTPQTPATSNFAKQETHPTLDGLGSTLAPPPAANQFGEDQNQASGFFNDAFTAESKGVTPAGTPGEDKMWESFINNDHWDDLLSSQVSQQ
ncbi:hypothetical protein EG329_007121 [Mollisiaceae sp. DMI_Dod_QoI]|nr:hypothetical protein EG329_007121 [Helotiales sp. DMI_Dod_QoI]